MQDEVYYLRALGDDPRKDIANIHQQFPDLAKDLNIPDFFEPSKFFSSVFRIASKGLQLWTHYDIMDNMLIQVTGHKRVVLFSPQEAENLYLDDEMYDHKDTYGNKDLVLAQRAMQIVDGAIKALDKLPEDYRDFYARRLVLRIQSKAYSKTSDL
nr:hypothetical protein BaRGS_024596 [Batillaria attramentaria]